jgi:hypothetical protein
MKELLHDPDGYYFYNSSIGDLSRLVEKYSVRGLSPTAGMITNAFGVKINPLHLPGILLGREGVEPPPIPANWHADVAEFGAALRAVDLAGDTFTAVELGCGWACWLNITGAVARTRGLDVRLIGVEGDAGHVRFAHESLAENGFTEQQFTIHHGVASSKEGWALFPRQERPGVNWGLEALSDVPTARMSDLERSGDYARLRQIPLDALLPADRDQIDLLHVDIQGAEFPLLPDSISFLRERVAFVLVGTHGRSIEGRLFDCFLGAGWSLEVERPAALAIGRRPHPIVDGVQLWRNPRLRPDDLVAPVSPVGRVQILDCPATVAASEQFTLRVILANDSESDWITRATDYPVRLSYHWLGQDDAFLQYEGLRTEFPDVSLNAGDAVTLAMNVIAPSRSGSARLKVTVVQDGIRWFDETAFRCATVDIEIR